MNDVTGKRLHMPAIALAIMGVSLLTGCAQSAPRFEANFGEAVRMANAQQTLNPDASRNADPVVGIDGRAADNAMQRYHKSFEHKEPQPPVITIGVGGK